MISMLVIGKRHFITLLTLTLLLAGLSLAQAWTGPTAEPPNSNVSAPYLNWGTTAGSGGYGLRDNAGRMEVKDQNGS